MGLHKRPDGCILFLDLFFKNRERPGRRSPMSPKHTIYCLGEVLLALDADAPLAHAESFGLASAGMPPCWHRPVPRRAGAPLFWPSWERTHSGSGPPPRSPPRAWIPHTRPFPAHCPPLCCLRPAARRSLTACAPPGCSLPRSSWSRGSSSPGTPCSLPPPAYATARCGTPI